MRELTKLEEAVLEKANQRRKVLPPKGLERLVNLKLTKKASAAQISQALSGYQFNIDICKAVIEAADEYEAELMKMAQ
jgi:hypothetical protein